MTPRAPSRLKAVGGNVVAFVVLPALLLLVVEAVVRLLAPDSFVLQRLDRQLLAGRSSPPGYVHRAGYEGEVYSRPVRINRQHLRGDDVAADDRPRVLFLGDSVVFAPGVAQDEATAALVEARLPVQALNAGTIGYSTADELDFLRAFGPALRPDAVVLVYCLNDPIRSDLPLNGIGVPGPRPTTARERIGAVRLWLRAHSALALAVEGARGMDWRLRTGSAIADSLHQGATWAEASGALRQIARWGRDHDVPFGIAVVPLRSQVRSGLDVGDLPQRRVRTVAEAEGVPVLDLRDALGDDDYLYGDGVHLDPGGLADAVDAMVPLVRTLLRGG